MKKLGEIIPPTQAVTLVPAQKSGAIANQKLIDDALQKLMTQPVHETTQKTIDSLTDLLGPGFKVETKSIWKGDEFQGSAVATVSRPAGITQRQINRANRIAAYAMIPSHEDDLLKEFDLLALKTVPRPGDTIDAAARKVLYVAELLAYPADVALAALRHPWKYFPAWVELQEVADRLAQPRKALVKALAVFKPWTVADEIASLDKAWSDAIFTQRYEYHTNPDRSSAAAEAADAFAARISALKKRDPGEQYAE